jgi:hypothetical protein
MLELIVGLAIAQYQPVILPKDADRPQDALFEAPVELRPGGERVTRLFPSPALFDFDGDGARDLVVGDLMGRLTAAAPAATGNDTAWTTSTPIQSEGKPLKLNNW